MMKRVMIIGSPGAGKSTLSRTLAMITNLPLYYMDSIFWKEDKSHLSREELIAKVKDIASTDEWIIDGNYTSSLDIRLKRADTVIFLDYPLDICLEGITSRIGMKREDMPWVEESLDEVFLQYVKDFHKDQVPEIKEMLKEHAHVVTLTSREACAQYVEKVKEEFGV